MSGGCPIHPEPQDMPLHCHGPIIWTVLTLGEQCTTHSICDMESDSFANPLLVVFAMDDAKLAVNFACLSIRLSACNNLKTAELNFIIFNTEVCGPGSSVGIATVYGMDGPGIEFRWGEIFRTSPDRP